MRRQQVEGFGFIPAQSEHHFLLTVPASKEESVYISERLTSQMPLSHLFGKELALLAWGIEDADPALIPIGIKNWLGLAPEEGWWLFTITNAATGHTVTGRNVGWRKAVRYALTENPVSEYQPQQPDMALFEVMEAEAPWASSVGSVRRKARPDAGSSIEKSRAYVQ